MYKNSKEEKIRTQKSSPIWLFGLSVNTHNRGGNIDDKSLTIGSHNWPIQYNFESNLVSCRKKEKLEEKRLKIVGVGFLSPLFKNNDVYSSIVSISIAHIH